MPAKITALLTIILLMGAGCSEATTTPIADTLGPAFGTGAVAQQQGFGILPSLPQSPINNNDGIVRINTTLPTLPENILVVRSPGSGFNLTQLQNLSHAINIPIGMLGTNPISTHYAFSWQNDENLSWSLNSSDHLLSFSIIDYVPELNLISEWPDQVSIEQAASTFLKSIGYDVLALQNISIEQNWLNWKLNTNNNTPCITQKLYNELNKTTSINELLDIDPLDPKYIQSSCASNNFPSYLIITFERVVDQRNIVNATGKPQIGGSLIYDINAQKFVHGWLTLPQEAQRSEYPAISEQEMKNQLEAGGMGGTPDGVVDIEEVFFSFISPQKTTDYDYEYLIPVLVGQGTQTINQSQNPYRIVVPLTQQ